MAILQRKFIYNLKVGRICAAGGKYLKELKDKYPEKATIANPKIGTELKGKHYLEIPKSNRSFYEASEQLKKMTADNKVEITFKVE